MPGFIGIQEIVLLMVVLLVIFGAKRLPEIGRSLRPRDARVQKRSHRKGRDVTLTDRRTTTDPLST